MFANPQTMRYAVITVVWTLLSIKGQAHVYPPVCFSGRTDVMRSAPPRVFLINQIYQSCAMHHKSITSLDADSSADRSHLSPSVAVVFVCVCALGAHCLVLPRLL